MTQNSQRDVKSNLKTFSGSLLLKIFYGLNRRIVRGRENYLKLTEDGKSVIIAVWHGHLLSVFYDLRDLKINALAEYSFSWTVFISRFSNLHALLITIDFLEAKNFP